MRKIRFGAVYCAPPVFLADVENMGYLEVEDLSIPQALVAEIRAWDAEFQRTFNDEYPPDSGFHTAEDLAAHNAEKLRNVLGSEAEIEFLPLEK
jgi:hypothetical protein